jgi:hypothetical protein
MARKANNLTKIMGLIRILNRHSHHQAIAITDCTSDSELAVEKLNDEILSNEILFRESKPYLYAIIRPTRHEEYGNLTINSSPNNSKENGESKIILPYVLLGAVPGALHLHSSSGSMSLEERFTLHHGVSPQPGFSAIKPGLLQHFFSDRGLDTILAISIRGVDTARQVGVDLHDYIHLSKGKIYLINAIDTQSDTRSMPLKAQAKQVNYYVK